VTCLAVLVFFAVLGAGMWGDRDRSHQHGA
jgi:hypothetical protein